MEYKKLRRLAIIGSIASTVPTIVKARIEAEAIRASFCLPIGFMVVAHSGCDSTPDNSLETIDKAIAQNADAVELDVSTRKDGTPVLLHSPIAKDDEGILLSDALKHISEKSDTLKVNLDLKCYNHIKKIEELATEYGLLSRIFFTGVRFKDVATVASSTALIPYYININPSPLNRFNEEYWVGLVSQAKMLGAIGVNCQYLLISKKATEICRKNGLLVSLWTVDNEDAINLVLTLLPDSITTKNPSYIIKKLRRK